MTRIWWLAILMMGMAAMTIHAQKAKAFTLVHHTHSVQIVGRGIKVNIDYADNDPEAVDVFAHGIADYLNSLGDNPEFPEANKTLAKDYLTGTPIWTEPVDVPAITRKRKECIKYSNLSFGNSPPCETYGDVDYAACEDETRILLPSQDGVMHCLKFPEAK